MGVHVLQSTRFLAITSMDEVMCQMVVELTLHLQAKFGSADIAQQAAMHIIVARQICQGESFVLTQSKSSAARTTCIMMHRHSQASLH